ncbi:MAG: hypothetical protein ACPGJR_02145 [Akkermansiaceae bacterium]
MAFALFAHYFACGKNLVPGIRLSKELAAQGIATLIMHVPDDAVMPLANAGKIYFALSHPKSFISLAGA